MNRLSSRGWGEEENRKNSEVGEGVEGRRGEGKGELQETRGS